MMKCIYIIKLILKSVLIVSIVSFVFMAVLQTSFEFNENPEPDFEDINDIIANHNHKLEDEQKDNSKTEKLAQTSIAPTEQSSSESENKILLINKHDVTVNNDGKPYLTSSEVESTVLDSKWDDHQKSERYHLRYWDLVRSENSSHITKTKPITQNKLDNLWKPLNGQPDADESDRFIPQLVWQMEASNSSFAKSLKTKKIVVWDSFNWWSKQSWGENGGSKQLLTSDCPHTPNSITQCVFTENTNDLKDVDAVIATRDAFHIENVSVPENILKFYFILESPFHSWVMLTRTEDLLAAYWRGSDLVTPYAQWAYYDINVKTKKQEINYAKGKRKTVAIFVSNCNAWNNRMGYVTELQKYIEVDVYGGCGTMRCERSEQDNCFTMLKKDYFFYLSFENSNCRDYITEKFFSNGLQNNVIPLVMGGHPDDYKTLAPYKSYIHIEEFDEPKELAEYLKFLIKNPEEYNRYFEWKGTGEFISSELFCRICAMVHYADFVPPPKRKKRFRWGHMQAIESGMCLNQNRWYWTKENNMIKSTSTTRDPLNPLPLPLPFGPNDLYDLNSLTPKDKLTIVAQ